MTHQEDGMDLAGIVERDRDVPWTASFVGEHTPTREVAWQAMDDRRILLGLLRETRTALAQTTNQLVLEHGPIGRDRECSGCRADHLRDSSRALLARLAALTDPTPATEERSER